MPDAPAENSEPEKALEDSDEVEVLDAQARLQKAEAARIEAEAKRKKAEATLAKARTPLVDKLIVRGLIPIALAIVGPWALWKFNTDVQDTKDQVTAQAKQLDDQKAVVGDLKKLRNDAIVYRQASSKKESAWRERMKKLEEGKAAEMAALAAMVTKLDEALKMSLLWQAMERAIQQDVSLFERPIKPMAGGRKSRKPPRVSLARLKARRDKIIEQSVRQVQLQDQNQEQTKEMAKRVFDRYVQDQEQQQAQQE
jgi:hypothetical protein